jgi:sialic acid synthase SpsE
VSTRLEIGGRRIGPGEPLFVIAEIALSHGGLIASRPLRARAVLTSRDIAALRPARIARAYRAGREVA